MNKPFSLVELKADGTFPDFKESHLYREFLKMEHLFPEKKIELLKTSHAIYARCRLRWEAEQGLNSDGGTHRLLETRVAVQPAAAG
jgi:hypothetical protein